MKCARDVMEPALVVSPELSIAGLARLLVERDADGVCVLEGDRLVGVATAMDLVYREKEVHPPAAVAVFDLVLQWGIGRTQRELEKIGASDVAGLMTRAVVTVHPDTTLTEVATRMVEEHLSLVPVLDGGVLVGAVTRRSVVAAILRSVAGMAG
jgi:CBS domain-containing protein